MHIDLANAAVVGGIATCVTWALKSFVLPKLDARVTCFLSAVAVEVVANLSGHAISAGVGAGAVNTVVASSGAGLVYDKVLDPFVGSLKDKVMDLLHSFGSEK